MYNQRMTKKSTPIPSTPATNPMPPAPVAAPFHHSMNPFEIFSEGISRMFAKYQMPAIVLIILSVVSAVFSNTGSRFNATSTSTGANGELNFNSADLLPALAPLAATVLASVVLSTAAIVLGKLSTTDEKKTNGEVLTAILETLPWAILKGLMYGFILLGVVLIGFVTLFIPLIIFAIKGSYAYYIAVGEKKGLNEAIKESFALVKGRKLETIALSIINGFVAGFVGSSLTYAVQARHLELLREIKALEQKPPTHVASKIVFWVYMGFIALIAIVVIGIIAFIAANVGDITNATDTIR
jgi:hypothetical protein